MVDFSGSKMMYFILNGDEKAKMLSWFTIVLAVTEDEPMQYHKDRKDHNKSPTFG